MAQVGEGERTWLDGEEEDPDASSFAAGQEPPELSGDEQDQGGVDENGIESYLTAQYEEAEALAAIHNAQRTLRQAREAQADSRLSRGFYRGHRPDGKGAGRGFPAGS